jgi:hypothetical protein
LSMGIRTSQEWLLGIEKQQVVRVGCNLSNNLIIIELS